MAVGFNSQQQKAIAAYRQQHNLGYVISDEEIASRIKKEGGTGASVFSQRNALPTANFSQGGGDLLHKIPHILFSAQAIKQNRQQQQTTVTYPLQNNRQQKNKAN